MPRGARVASTIAYTIVYNKAAIPTFARPPAPFNVTDFEERPLDWRDPRTGEDGELNTSQWRCVGPRSDYPSMMNTIMIIALALAWIALLLGGYISWQLLSQNGRILLRLDDIEERFH
jgi:hypothetical protein